MPRIEARMYVNVRLLTTESGPGTVLSRMVVRPEGRNMLEVLRNGGGKSTLTAIELFSLVPRLGGSRSRMRDLFRTGVGPSYVAYDLRRTGKSWAKGYAHVYLICAFERRAGENGAGDVRRIWAFLPAVSVGGFDTLPLTTDEGGRRYPVSLDEFERWAREVPEGTCLGDRNLSTVEEELRRHGLSPSELGTQLQINYDEGGIENFFSKGTTPESFFQSCLMPVVEDGVLGDRDKTWLVEASVALAETARDQKREISRLEVYRIYGSRLKDVRGALCKDHAARQELSELKYRAEKSVDAAEGGVAGLRRGIADAEKRMNELDQEMRRIEYVRLSTAYHMAEEKLLEDKDTARNLREKSDSLDDEVRRMDSEISRIAAVEAYAKWRPVAVRVAALDHTISTLEEQSGTMGAEVRRLQAMAMAAWEMELTNVDEALDKARLELEEAHASENEARKTLDEVMKHRDQTMLRVGAAETEFSHAKGGLFKAVEEGLEIEECHRIIDAPDLTGKYDFALASHAVETVARKLQQAHKKLDDAKRTETDAEAAVLLQEESYEKAREQERERKEARDDLSDRERGAQASFESLDAILAQLAPASVGMRDVNLLKETIAIVGDEIGKQRTDAKSEKESLRAQLAAFEHGVERTDPRILAILDVLGIKARSVRGVAEEQGIDLETYVREAPWLADVLFMDADDCAALEHELQRRCDGASLVAVTATDEDLDQLLGGWPFSVRICSNAIADWVIDPERWKRGIENKLEKVEHDLESISFQEKALEDARNGLADCRAALEGFDSLDDLKRKARIAQSTWEESRILLMDAERQLKNARDNLDERAKAREGFEANCASLESMSDKWIAVRNAIETYNRCVEVLAMAEEERMAAERTQVEARDKLEAAKESRNRASDAHAHCGSRKAEITKRRDEVWSNTLVPSPDPDSRDAEFLTAAWRDAAAELERESEDLGRRIREKRADLKNGRNEEKLLQTSLERACTEAGLTLAEIEAQARFTDTTKGRQLQEQRAVLAEKADKARRHANEASNIASRSEGRFESMVEQLESSGFTLPLPKEECRNVNVPEARKRIETEQSTLKALVKEMGDEKSQLQVIASSSAQIAQQLEIGGAYREFMPLSSAPIDEENVVQEFEVLVESFRASIERRERTRSEAANRIEATQLDILDEEAKSRAEQTRYTLHKTLGDVSEYEADGALRNLNNAIEDCDKLVGLLEGQLEEYESRLGQTAKTCASDVAEALARLDGIVRDATIDVSLRDEPRKRAEFLEILLGGRKVSDISRSKGRVDLVAEIEQKLLPYLRSHIEDEFAPIDDRDEIRRLAQNTFSLSRLLRVYVGDGKTPCGLNVRHATYTKLETRRHKDWNTLFKRSAMAQSGAETTLVFFVIYLAITKSSRQAEIPQGDDDQRFVILDNPFTKMSDRWAVEFLGKIANHFDCQMIVKTALQEIASHNVFPYVCSYRETRVTGDGTRVMDVDVRKDGVPDEGMRDFDVFATVAEQMKLGI